MSVLASSTAWQHSTAKATTLLVLLALCDHAHDDGTCWPSVDEIAQKSRCSRSTVFGCFRELEKAGELERIRRPNRSNLFRVLPQFLGPPLVDKVGPESGLPEDLRSGFRTPVVQTSGRPSINQTVIETRSEDEPTLWITELEATPAEDIARHVAEIRAALKVHPSNPPQ